MKTKKLTKKQSCDAKSKLQISYYDIQSKAENFNRDFKLRQTGRTTEIAMFASKQLFLHGEVVIHDHTAVEYPGVECECIHMHLKNKVEKIMRSFHFDHCDDHELHFKYIPTNKKLKLPALLHLTWKRIEDEK